MHLKLNNNFSNYSLKPLPLAIYYAVLLIISLSWTEKSFIEPVVSYRLVFTFFFVAPVFRYPNIVPSILTIFVSIRLFSVAPYGYLPTATKYYLLFVVILFFYCKIRGVKLSNNTIKGFIPLFTCVLFSNLINLNIEYEFIFSIILIILLSKFLISDNDIYLMEFSFILVTFCLSIYAFVFFDDFVTQEYASDFKIQRVIWNDANYLGGLLTIGIVIAFYNLMHNFKLNLSTRIFYSSTFIIGIITIAMLASRGAFLALVIPVLYILYKKLNSIKNLIIVMFFIILTYYILSQTLIFNALINRFLDSSVSTGSERTVIWSKSIDSFFKSDSKTLIFGGGSDFSLTLCGNALGRKISSPHNNFLQILFDYGISGFFVFITLVITWIKKNYKNVLSISLILLFLTLAMSLVPLMYLPFWFLIMLIEKHQFINKLNNLNYK